MPARPDGIAAFIKDRGQQGAAPASLARAKASLAKRHKLCRLPDPTTDELVMLTLAGLRREKGVAQRQARPLRAGIMDALRWKSPRMPLAYNRNLVAEQGAAGRLLLRMA